MTIIASHHALDLRADLTSAWSMTPLQSWAFLALAGLAVWGVVQIVLAVEARNSSEDSPVTGAAAGTAADPVQPPVAHARSAEHRPVSQFYDQDAPENQGPRIRALNSGRAVVVPADELELRRRARDARRASTAAPRPRLVQHRPVSQFFDQDAPEFR